LAGATGLVGGKLLQLLLSDADYTTVVALTRRSLGETSPKLVEVIADFDRSETYRERLAVDDVYCCLGTTMRNAGSQEAFRKVDFDYPVALARHSLERGAQRFLIVTAVGANAKSRVFYSRVKGEVEAAVSELPFPGGVKVFRPSMLLGDRAESRPMERAAAAAMRAGAVIFSGALKRYRAIDAGLVARAMLNVARTQGAGFSVVEGERLFAAAQG
jgi:uncharacterized protein YbjT (DUF2867 family)